MNQSRLNHGYSYRERVGPRGAGLSVLEYYARFYPHSGGETWAARLAAGEIELDGQRAGGSERLRAGSRLVRCAIFCLMPDIRKRRLRWRLIRAVTAMRQCVCSR